MSLSFKKRQLKNNHITNEKNMHSKINIFTMLGYKVLKSKYSKFFIFALFMAISFSVYGICKCVISCLAKFNFAFYSLEQTVQNINLFDNTSITLNFVNAWTCVFFIIVLIFVCFSSFMILIKCFKIFVAFNSRNLKIK